MAYKNSPVFFFLLNIPVYLSLILLNIVCIQNQTLFFFKPQKKQIDILRTDQIFLF